MGNAAVSLNGVQQMPQSHIIQVLPNIPRYYETTDDIEKEINKQEEEYDKV